MVKTTSNMIFQVAPLLHCREFLVPSSNPSLSSETKSSHVLAPFLSSKYNDQLDETVSLSWKDLVAAKIITYMPQETYVTMLNYSGSTRNPTSPSNKYQDLYFHHERLGQVGSNIFSPSTSLNMMIVKIISGLNYGDLGCPALCFRACRFGVLI